jgi:hypothetical protein
MKELRDKNDRSKQFASSAAALRLETAGKCFVVGFDSAECSEVMNSGHAGVTALGFAVQLYLRHSKTPVGSVAKIKLRKLLKWCEAGLDDALKTPSAA